MKILLTAFEPFDSETINSALEAVKLVADKIGGADIVKLTVPTVFRKSVDVVTMVIEREKPDAVLCIGQAGKRSELTPERVAINIDDARIPDNEGNQPVDCPIIPDGAPAYFSTLPVKAMVKAIRDAGIPASVSNSAGTFVCNHLMYGLLHVLAEKYPNVRGGFMHVPYAPCQVLDRPSTPSMSISDIATGIEAAVKVMV